MVEDSDVWDRDLGPREVEVLSPQYKKFRSRKSLERKVECLERWGANRRLSRQHEAEIPWKRPALRSWHNSELKLWRWAYNPVDLPQGNNKDLMDRYTEALENLRKMLGDEPGVEMGALLKRIENLERQNISLLDRVSQLQRLIPQPTKSR